MSQTIAPVKHDRNYGGHKPTDIAGGSSPCSKQGYITFVNTMTIHEVMDILPLKGEGPGSDTINQYKSSIINSEVNPIVSNSKPFPNGCVVLGHSPTCTSRDDSSLRRQVAMERRRRRKRH